MENPAPAQRWAICLEQTLGHRAHGRVLEEAATSLARPAVDVFHIEYPEASRIRAPWALRGSFDALRQLRASTHPYDVAFFHTQTISLFAPVASRAKRFVVSVDATPRQMDAIGTWYDHRRGAAPGEFLKSQWYRRVLSRASAVVSWSRWAAGSLEADYGVSSNRIHVLHPGAPARFFSIDRSRVEHRTPRILFVGGDFERKGGTELLQAFRARSREAELTIVTESEIPDLPEGTRVLRGLRPGSPELLRAYAESDIFCLPTRADCTPIVLAEAMAAGLPVITTRVGSNHETIADGETGLLVDVGDTAGLTTTLNVLLEDPCRRRIIGARARDYAACHLDADQNAAGVLRVLEEVAS